MRYAIIADAHGRPNELSKALHLAESADRIVYLGDVPAYRNSNGLQECLEALLREDAWAVRGNCDAYVLRCQRPPEIGEEAWDYYASWPTEHREGNLLFLHGGPREPLEERIDGEEKAWRNFLAKNFFVCFHGHQHRVTCYEHLDNNVRYIDLKEDKPLVLNADARYIIGVGSVGDPRDEWRGSIIFYDSNKREVSLQRFQLG